MVEAQDRAVRRHRMLRMVRVMFRATVVGGDLTHELEGSTDQARWVPIPEVGGLERVQGVDVGLAWWRRHRDTPPDTPG